ncbi:MAG: sulfatase-like hydrolase/transferase, partial [Candidatus Aminicenantes bacterium]|nr:sulfatase-like hydrolase/transferase [Candidatus Aminicenantes bacterium]
MFKRTIAVLSFFATVLLLLLGCDGSPSTPRYIFLVTLDTTRADFVNYALQNNEQTPHFASLAAKGMVFENAYTLIPITLPSHASMMYSQPPHLLKVYNNGNYSRVDKPALAQLLRDRGFQTGAVISLGVLRAEAGLDQGFDRYMEDFRPGLWHRTAAEVNRDAIRQISGLKGKEAFIWIHYSDPHGPYFTPEYDEKFGVFLNEKEIFSARSTDQFVANLELDLIPGRNVLKMNTEIPAVNRNNQPIFINNIAFMNFMASGMDDASGVQMDLPSGWNRVQQRRGNVTYFSKESNSRI